MTASSIRADDGLQAALYQLRSYASSLGRKDSEDLVQEAAARAIAHGVSVEALPWLRTVVRHLAIDRARRSHEVASGDSADMDAPTPEPGEGPEDVVLSGERARAVRDALDALPPRYREALIAYADDGRAASVAERMSLSSQATWTLLSRARERLRAQLERAGFVPALFAARFAPWSSAAATGALTVCCFIATLGGGASPPSRPSRQEPAVVAPALTAPASPGSAASLGPHAAARAPSSSKVVSPGSGRSSVPPVRYRAETCAQQSDGLLHNAGGELWFEDEGHDSHSSTVIDAMPTEARTMLVGGCAQ